MVHVVGLGAGGFQNLGADYLEPCWFRGELNGHASLYRAAALHVGGGNHAVQMKHAVLNSQDVARCPISFPVILLHSRAIVDQRSWMEQAGGGRQNCSKDSSNVTNF